MGIDCKGKVERDDSREVVEGLGLNWVISDEEGEEEKEK